MKLFRPLIALALILAVATAFGQTSPWPRLGQNSQSSGSGPGAGSNGLLRWKSTHGTYATSSAVIGADGTIYVVSWDGHLYALNPDGSTLWSVSLVTISNPLSVAATPSLGPDGTIYVVNDESSFVAVSPAGNIKWTFLGDSAGDLNSSPAFTTDGTVYVLDEGNLTALNPADGSVKWQFQDPSQIIFTGQPSIGPDGTIYVSNPNRLCAVTPGGVSKWTVIGKISEFQLAPVVGPDGTIYVSNEDYSLGAYNPDGTLKWQLPAGTCATSPAIGPNGNLIIPSGNGTLDAYGPDGSHVWSASVPSGAGLPAIASDGTIYCGSADGTIYGVSSTGQIMWTLPTGGKIQATPSIGMDGTVYVPSTDGYLYAIGTQVNTVPLKQLVLSVTTLVGGTSAIGTVTIASPAPAGGDIVRLASSDPSTTVPGYVVVPGGATTATFNITTSSVSANAAATLSGKSGGQGATATLTVLPTGLSTFNTSDTSVIGGVSTTGSVTIGQAAPTGGKVIALYSNSANVVPPVSVTIAAGKTSATFPIQTVPVGTSTSATITATLGSASLSAPLTVTAATLSTVASSASSLVANQSAYGTVTLTGFAPAGGTTVALKSNSSAVVVPASMIVPGGTASGTFTITTTNVASLTNATVTATLAGQTTKVALTVAPLALNSLRFSASSVTGGSSATGTVTLNGAAPTGGSSVSLTNTSADVKVPATVTVPAGSSSTTFPVSTKVVAVQKTATVSATFSGHSVNAALTVNPATIASVTLFPSSVTGGTESAGTVTLTGPAPAGGLTVKVKSSATVAKPAASVFIASGKSSGAFKVTTTATVTATTATLTATLGTNSANASLTVNPPKVASLSLSPSTVIGKQSSTATVTLTGPAPTGGITLQLSTGSSTASVPTNVVIAAGRKSGTFMVKTKAVTSQSTATISASLAGQSVAATLTVKK